jgi:thymidylate synthase (FAD)
MIKTTLIDYMGSDLSVVNAARVSFGKKHDTFQDKDKKLIQYLAKHKHMSPFGHAFASFHVKAPIFVARQLVKHKFLRWNEISRRYVDGVPEFYVPDTWRGRSVDKKQGSSQETVEFLSMQGFSEQSVNDGTFKHQMHSLDLYRDMITAGVAPEQARMVLPQSTMTEWYWSGSLDAFASMCVLRCASDTQYETRVVADYINMKMQDIFPVSWAALMGVANVQQFSEYGNYGENNPPLGDTSAYQ